MLDYFWLLVLVFVCLNYAFVSRIKLERLALDGGMSCLRLIKESQSRVQEPSMPKVVFRPTLNLLKKVLR